MLSTVRSWPRCEWHASADGIVEIVGEAEGERAARNAARLALRIAAYNAREACSTGRSSHYYLAGAADANGNVFTWCGRLFWPGEAAYDARYMEGSSDEDHRQPKDI